MSRNGEGVSGLETVKYIEDMLVELRNMSHQAGQPMLSYFIEMAMVEAADISAGRRSSPFRQTDLSPSEIANLFENRPSK